MATAQDYKSSLEAIAAIGSAMALEPLAGYYGLGRQAFTDEPLAHTIEEMEWLKGLAYKPDDPRTLQEIGRLMQPIGEAYEAGTDWLGDTTFDATGSPTLASIAKTSPEIVGGILGLRALRKANAPEVPPDAPAETFDASRRKFIKDAGLVTAGVAATKLGLPDIEVPASLKGAAPAAQSVVRATSSISPNVASLVAKLRPMLEEHGGSVNDLGAAFDKGGVTGFNKAAEAIRNASRDKQGRVMEYIPELVPGYEKDVAAAIEVIRKGDMVESLPNRANRDIPIEDRMNDLFQNETDGFNTFDNYIDELEAGSYFDIDEVIARSVLNGVVDVDEIPDLIKTMQKRLDNPEAIEELANSARLFEVNKGDYLEKAIRDSMDVQELMVNYGYLIPHNRFEYLPD